MDEKIGYKVITKDTRQSCTVPMRTFPRKYEKNKETIPANNCGPLAIFKHKESAETFKNKIEGINQPLIIVKCKDIETKNKIELWEPNPWPPFDTYTQQKFPPGTVLADSVTCLE